MFILDGSMHEAPLIEDQASADLTDVYAYVDADDRGSDATAAKEVDFASQVLMAEEEASQVARSDSTEDVFVFLTGLLATGDGSVIPNSSVPAPEEEEPGPPELGWEWEIENLGTARHTATGAMLQRFLVFG